MPLCECGKPYYPDSTGEGPCHIKCGCGCGELVSDDNCDPDDIFYIDGHKEIEDESEI